MYTMIQVLGIVSVLLEISLAYHLGAPSGACDGMIPGHATFKPQQSTAQYTLTMAKSTYSANEVIQGTLTGSVAFRGFLIQPRRNDKSFNTLGKLTAVSPDMKNACVDLGKTALTHTNNTDKTSVSFKWTAPSQDSGNVVFVYTVVQQFNTFWAKITGPTLTFQKGSGQIVG